MVAVLVALLRGKKKKQKQTNLTELKCNVKKKKFDLGGGKKKHNQNQMELCCGGM